MTNLIRCVGMLALLAATAMPQATLQVGVPGGFAQIRDALSAAQPGDILLVYPGTYAYFEADVGVTIRAVTPGTAVVEFDLAFVPPGCTSLCVVGQHTRIAPPAGQQTHVVGLHFAPTVVSASGFSISQRVAVAGRVTFDQCVFESQTTIPLSVTNSPGLHLQSCTLRALATGFVAAPALYAENSSVTAVECTFEGLASSLSPSGSIELAQSELHASGITVTSSPAFGALAGTALSLDATSTAWISDSLLIGGAGSCALGQPASNVFADRTTVTNATTGCPAPMPGGARLGVQRPLAPSPGASFAVEFRSDANNIVAVFAATRLDNVAAMPLLQQPVWLPPGESLLVDLLVTNAAGVATATLQLPAGPGIADQRLWLQGVTGVTMPLQTSPVVGGVVR